MANFDGLDPEFRRRLEALIAASGGRITVISAFRSVEEQQRLWNNALAKYGSEQAARKWVAPPGSSNHNHGLAADLSYTNGGMEWAHANAHRFGLEFPLDWEDWHIEPLGLRDGAFHPNDDHDHDAFFPSPEAYVDPPTEQTLTVMDDAHNFELETQIRRVAALLANPPTSLLDSPSNLAFASPSETSGVELQ